MESIDLNYIQVLQNFYNEYINNGILDCVFVRGSLANNYLDNKISDIDLIVFYKDKRSMSGLINRFNRILDEKFLVKLPLDIMYFHINETLIYNMVYVLKYKSKHWLGNDKIAKYIKSLNIKEENIPYSNVYKITSLLDPIVDSEILKVTANIDLTHIKLSTRHTVSLLKKIIRSIYEYLYLTNKITFIVIPCKEICENIIQSDIDSKWKNIITQCSEIIEECKKDYFFTEKNTNQIIDLYKTTSLKFKDETIRKNIEKIRTDPKYTYLQNTFSIE